MSANKDTKTTKQKIVEFITTEKLPDFLMNLLQYYLIFDKIFCFDRFGYLNWFQVFTPLWVSILFALVFGDDELEEKK